MMFLTPYLTLLRLQGASGAVIHAPLWPDQPDAIDLNLDLPSPLSFPVSVPGLPGYVAAPGTNPGLVTISLGNQDLYAVPGQPATWLRPHLLGRFELLPLTEADVALLRYVLTHCWAAEFPLLAAAEVTVCPAEPFRLDLGPVKVDLARGLPRQKQDGTVTCITTEGPASLRCIGKALDEIRMAGVAAFRRPAFVSTPAEFAAGSDRRLRIESTPEILTMPFTVCDADAAWLYDKPYANRPYMAGLHTLRPNVVRLSNKLVILARHLEGMIFDEHGIYSETGYLHGIGHGGNRSLPPSPGMRCEGERHFVDRAAVSDAPSLPGSYIVFCTGVLSNYTHWLIDNLLHLHVMLPYAPPGAKLLLPATLRSFRDNPTKICDHHDIMRAFGFADLPAVEIDQPYCRVEDVIWLENAFIDDMPADRLRALRAHVASLRPPPTRRDRRLYIARRANRRVVNTAALEPFLRAQSFTTYFLEDLTIDEQIDLFSEAEWVIGPHGAELGNLLFCQPGTKVLEISPDVDFKPYYAYMSSKLGHVHGVLPCPTTDGGFFGDMTVNMPKLAALYRMMKHRL